MNLFFGSTKIIPQIKKGYGYLVLMGFCSAIALMFQMVAVKMTIVPYVIAIKRMSIVISSIFGFVLFKEGKVKERLVGALIMIVGVCLISLS